jgi:hypothetical protein
MFMTWRYYLALACWLGATSVYAEDVARVELTVGAETRGAAASAQQWLEVLTECGVDGLRIRQREPGETPEVKNRGEKSAPDYHVFGVLTAKNQLAVPGHTFSLRDRDGISAWLKQLREEGIDRAAGAEAGPFGLSPQQLEALREDLSAPVTVTTVDMTPSESLTRLTEGLKVPLALDPAAKPALAEAEANQEELTGLSTGTSLAYLIRSAGLGMEPVRGKQDEVVLTVRRADQAKEVWPVGFEPEEKPEKLVEDFYEFLTVEIEDTALTDVLGSLNERLKLPMLYDHYALALHGIDPAAARVNLPEKRMTYSMVLSKSLSQAKLKYELRVDEANRPFAWITTQAPVR